jgi:uncharacterized membrane protein YccC
VGEPLLFAIRLWASVCLALFVAFWLELDNPFWAGASAAIVNQPQLGASLRKSWFRIIGTVVGATMVVVLTAWFPQDRVGFLGGLALWGGICSFMATALRNFASYAAALAGYTAAIIAADNLGATGGADPDIFMLAITRASEICIGIVCAGVFVAGTDLGGSGRRLAASFANLASEIAGRFAHMLNLPGSQLTDTQTERRDLLRRVILLDPMIDQALGESAEVRYRSSTLERAVHGLFRALDGWRGIAAHLSQLPHDEGRQAAQTILRGFPPDLWSARDQDTPGRWMAAPLELRRACAEAARRLIALPAGTPSLRLLADETAKLLAGIVRTIDGLALLVGVPGRSYASLPGFQLSVPDWLPALVNATRAFFTIGAAELFWIATAWPDGASVIVFTTALLLLISPRGDVAYFGSIAVAVGLAFSIVSAAIIKFAVLPAFETFPAFCVAIGIFLIPVGFAMAWSSRPAAMAVLNPAAFTFVSLLAPTNQMTYDTTQFYNSALAILVACAVVPLVFSLVPPLPPAQRAGRLLSLTLRDLRRVAIDRHLPRPEEWERRMYGRLAAMPDQAEPLQRARLLAALSVGTNILDLRRTAARLGVAAGLDAALAAFAGGNIEVALRWLRHLDRRVASAHQAGFEEVTALRARSQILVMSEGLSGHAAYFGTRANA